MQGKQIDGRNISKEKRIIVQELLYEYRALCAAFVLISIVSQLMKVLPSNNLHVYVEIYDCFDQKTHPGAAIFPRISNVHFKPRGEFRIIIQIKKKKRQIHE